MSNLVFLGPHVQITGGDDDCEGSQQPFGSWLRNRELATFQPAYLSLAAVESRWISTDKFRAPGLIDCPTHHHFTSRFKICMRAAQEGMALNALLHSWKRRILH